MGTPVVAGDDASASAGAFLTFWLDLVERSEALLVVGSAELVGELVIANASDVGHSAGG